MKALLLLQILFLVAQNGGYTEMPYYTLFAPLYTGLAIGVFALICLICGVVCKVVNEVKK